MTRCQAVIKSMAMAALARFKVFGGPERSTHKLIRLAMSSRHLVSYCMRLLRSEGAKSAQKRGMAGHVSPPPKPDTSMDHVFGDNSYKVDFDVSTEASHGACSTSTLTILTSLRSTVQPSIGNDNLRVDGSDACRLRLPRLDDGLRGEQNV
jgi:hypothetical protein